MPKPLWVSTYPVAPSLFLSHAVSPQKVGKDSLQLMEFSKTHGVLWAVLPILLLSSSPSPLSLAFLPIPQLVLANLVRSTCHDL